MSRDAEEATIGCLFLAFWLAVLVTVFMVAYDIDRIADAAEQRNEVTR